MEGEKILGFSTQIPRDGSTEACRYNSIRSVVPQWRHSYFPKLSHGGFVDITKNVDINENTLYYSSNPMGNQ
jgi:hypothetical protein